MHGPIADQQDRIRLGGFGPSVQGQGLDLRLDAELLAEDHLGQAGTGSRSLIQGEGPNLTQGHAAVEFDAQHRAVCGDAGIRHDHVIRVGKRLDRRDQGHIQPTLLQFVRQSARHIQQQ